MDPEITEPDPRCDALRSVLVQLFEMHPLPAKGSPEYDWEWSNMAKNARTLAVRYCEENEIVAAVSWAMASAVPRNEVKTYAALLGVPHSHRLSAVENALGVLPKNYF